MKCYRRIIGKTRRDRIMNERIWEGLKQKSVYEILQKRQLKWFGHVVRMDERRKPRQKWRQKGERGGRNKCYNTAHFKNLFYVSK